MYLPIPQCLQRKAIMGEQSIQQHSVREQSAVHFFLCLVQRKKVFTANPNLVFRLGLWQNLKHA